MDRARAIKKKKNEKYNVVNNAKGIFPTIADKTIRKQTSRELSPAALVFVSRVYFQIRAAHTRFRYRRTSRFRPY